MKTKFIHSLMFAENDADVSKVISDNIELLFSNPELWKYVRNSKRRIRRIKREKQKSWLTYQLN